LHFGGPCKAAVLLTKVERFDAHAIAHEYQLVLPGIPQGYCKHASQVVDETLAMLLVQMHDDFNIAAAAKPVSALLQHLPQLAEVVDLPVADSPDCAVFIAERLLAAADIDNRQPPHAEHHGLTVVESLIVGTSMQDRICHAADDCALLIANHSVHCYADDSAHFSLQLLLGSFG